MDVKMKGHRGSRTGGFTLLELMVALLVMAILIGGAHHVRTDWLPRERVIAASNSVLGLMRRARLRASLHGAVALCDGRSLCDHFGTTNRLLLASDADGDGTIQADDVIERLRLPPGTTLVWIRFRGRALHYGHRGNLFYQNGHFLICNHHQARRIIMNVIGTVRVAPGDADQCPGPIA